jgi:type VI secretion system protein ImpL
MGKIFGAIFNRWTLLLVLLLALLAVIWLIGPLVAIGNWRPLESETARWVMTGLVLVTVLAVIVWKIVKAKLGNAKVVNQLAAAPAGPAAAAESPDMQAVRQRFAEALATLKNARFGADAAGGGLSGKLQNSLGGRYLYQLPWYLIIGAPGSGKTTALQNAGLQFPLQATHGSKAIRGVGGTRLCDWWFTDRHRRPLHHAGQRRRGRQGHLGRLPADVEEVARAPAAERRAGDGVGERPHRQHRARP